MTGVNLDLACVTIFVVCVFYTTAGEKDFALYSREFCDMLHHNQLILMLSVIIVLKSCSTGGMKAVVWTDVFQLVGHHIGQHQHHYCCHDHWLLSSIVHLILLVFSCPGQLNK